MHQLFENKTELFQTPLSLLSVRRTQQRTTPSLRLYEIVPAKYTFLDWKQTWLETDDMIRETISSVTTGPTDRQVLTLVNPSYQDTGVYSCAATNNISRLGTSAKEMHRTVYLIIKCKFVLNKDPTSDTRVVVSHILRK